MKSFKLLSTNISECEYRRLPMLSFSTISKYYKDGPAKISELFESVSKPYFTFGKIVDKLITEPDKFRDEFCIISKVSIGPKKLECIDQLFNITNGEYENISDIPEDIFKKALDKADYWSSWSIDKRIASVCKDDGISYYKAKRESINKTLITNEDYVKANLSSNVILKSNQTKSFFEVKDGEEHLYQVKLLSNNVHKRGIRCMLDKIIVNHKEKTILPIDIKTTGKSEYEFKKSYMDFSYWMQSNIYTMVLEDVILGDDYFKDFKILPFVFIVVNKDSLSPIVFVDEHASHKGDRITSYGKVLKDWRVIADDLCWHLDNPSVKCPKDVYDKNYVVFLDNLKPLTDEEEAKEEEASEFDIFD